MNSPGPGRRCRAAQRAQEVLASDAVRESPQPALRRLRPAASKRAAKNEEFFTRRSGVIRYLPPQFEYWSWHRDCRHFRPFTRIAGSFQVLISYPTLIEKLPILAFPDQNHPFVDGNKRVGHAAME